MKVLFFATYPTQPIGYARIGSRISNFLASKDNIDLYYIGISNFKDNSVSRYINPKIKLIDALEESKKINSAELYGVDIFTTLIDSIKPDVLFIYNDSIVISRLFNEIIIKKPIHKNYTTITYLDLVYDYQKLELVNHINIHSDYIFVFSEYWKTHLEHLNINKEKIKVFPHGFDNDIFSIIDKYESKKHFNMDEKDFVVLNTNRNAYRKALDITTGAFLLFYKEQYEKIQSPPNIKLFLNCSLKTSTGYNIVELINVECKRLNIDSELTNFILNNVILSSPNNAKLSDIELNQLYNACDVGMNTCIGEGFGLCNLEHACLGKPQIVTETGGLKDIFSGNDSIAIKPSNILYIPNLTEEHNGDMHICNRRDFADALKVYYEDEEKRTKDGNDVSNRLTKQYSWDKLLTQFSTDFNTMTTHGKRNLVYTCFGYDPTGLN